MSTCPLCNSEIASRPCISMAGGFFPASEPDIFCPDEDIMAEGYIHLDCFKEAVRAYVLTIAKKS